MPFSSGSRQGWRYLSRSGRRKTGRVGLGRGGTEAEKPHKAEPISVRPEVRPGLRGDRAAQSLRGPAAIQDGRVPEASPARRRPQGGRVESSDPQEPGGSSSWHRQGCSGARGEGGEQGRGRRKGEDRGRRIGEEEVGGPVASTSRSPSRSCTLSPESHTHVTGFKRFFLSPPGPFRLLCSLTPPPNPAGKQPLHPAACWELCPAWWFFPNPRRRQVCACTSACAEAECVLCV